MAAWQKIGKKDTLAFISPPTFRIPQVQHPEDEHIPDDPQEKRSRDSPKPEDGRKVREPEEEEGQATNRIMKMMANTHHDTYQPKDTDHLFYIFNCAIEMLTADIPASGTVYSCFTGESTGYSLVVPYRSGLILPCDLPARWFRIRNKGGD